MLSRSFKALVVGAVVAAGIAVSVDPAAAQYRRYRGYNYGPAVGAGVALGIIGLAGAAIAADQRRQAREEYYGRGYGYGGGYYAPPPRAYYYAPPPRTYYEAPPRAYYAPPPRSYYRDDGYASAPRPVYRQRYDRHAPVNGSSAPGYGDGVSMP
jgi:hypothetical protein